MILIGSQRSGARDLALHLLKEENDHVLVHEVRGFATDDLEEAFNEAYAMSRGTRCKHFLFSMSINPPPDRQFSTQDFEQAIEKAEERLGLSGQPRAIVFHEKACADGQQRRHAHAVWSRIDTEEMKAVQLSHTRVKLREISRELHIEHNIQMPRGLADRSKSDPRNFSYEEWQQARRFGHDPRTRKAAIQDASAISDSKEAFTHALEERGYSLARGDRRGFVAVDRDGEIHSLSRQIGMTAKDVKARLGDAELLPAVHDVQIKTAYAMQETLSRINRQRAESDQTQREEDAPERAQLVERQRRERAETFARIERERQAEAVQRQSRFRQGIRGLWDIVSGERKRIQRQNEIEALQALARDQKRRDDLIFMQIEARDQLRRGQMEKHRKSAVEREELSKIRQHYDDVKDRAQRDKEEFIASRRAAREPPERGRIRGLERER